MARLTATGERPRLRLAAARLPSSTGDDKHLHVSRRSMPFPQAETLGEKATTRSGCDNRPARLRLLAGLSPVGETPPRPERIRRTSWPLAALRLVRSVNLDPASPHHRPWLGCRRAARTPLSAFGLWLCRFPPLCWRREPTGIQRSLKVVCPKLHMGVRPESKSCIEKAKKTDWRNLAYNSHLKSEFWKIG